MAVNYKKINLKKSLFILAMLFACYALFNVSYHLIGGTEANAATTDELGEQFEATEDEEAIALNEQIQAIVSSWLQDKGVNNSVMWVAQSGTRTQHHFQAEVGGKVHELTLINGEMTELAHKPVEGWGIRHEVKSGTKDGEVSIIKGTTAIERVQGKAVIVHKTEHKLSTETDPGMVSFVTQHKDSNGKIIYTTHTAPRDQKKLQERLNTASNTASVSETLHFARLANINLDVNGAVTQIRDSITTSRGEINMEQINAMKMLLGQGADAKLKDFLSIGFISAARNGSEEAYFKRWNGFDGLTLHNDRAIKGLKIWVENFMGSGDYLKVQNCIDALKMIGVNTDIFRERAQRSLDAAASFGIDRIEGVLALFTRNGWTPNLGRAIENINKDVRYIHTRLRDSSLTPSERNDLSVSLDLKKEALRLLEVRKREREKEKEKEEKKVTSTKKR